MVSHFDLHYLYSSIMDIFELSGAQLHFITNHENLICLFGRNICITIESVCEIHRECKGCVFLTYDKIIIGAGLYGLYAALQSAKKYENQHLLVLEKDSVAFMRATYINQARVHMGYHYPRSLSTAAKSAHYFKRFMDDFAFSCLTTFDQIYATSGQFSWTNAEEFRKFCRAANIRCDDISPEKYFQPGMCDGTFLTEEYTYDAHILRDYFLGEIAKHSQIEIRYRVRPNRIEQKGKEYVLTVAGEELHTPYLLNATYASANEINALLGFEPFKIKYELCEIILCIVNEALKNVGLTVMDGPFFSIMPFGKTGYHSLTSVAFTPHVTSYDALPTFACQQASEGYCTPECLGNCNECSAKPASAWPYMSSLARKYIRPEYEFRYHHSLFSMKPILKASEIDDYRPTVVRVFSVEPTYVAVLSGKINTVYDLDEVL